MPNYPQHPSIHRIFSKGQPLAFGRGDIVLGNDTKPDGLYYLNTGYAKVYSLSDKGEEYTHIIYGPGEIFPLIWAYTDEQPEHLFYEAISETVMWRLSKEWFHMFITSEADFAYGIAVQLAYQFQIYSDRVENLEYKKASERVIYRLLFLANRFGRRSEDARITIEAPFTHELLATTVNLARESVSRELEKLEAAQLVKHSRRTIVLLDIMALAARLSQPTNIGNWRIFKGHG